ncbi:hypothetical protein D3C85_1462850 [compost metagenome]
MLFGSLLNLVVCCSVAVMPKFGMFSLVVFTFGLGWSLPLMNLFALHCFGGAKGLGSSVINFIQMSMFAIASAIIAPMLYGSSILLAIGLVSTVALASVLWGTSVFDRR